MPLCPPPFIIISHIIESISHFLSKIKASYLKKDDQYASNDILGMVAVDLKFKNRLSGKSKINDKQFIANTIERKMSKQILESYH